VLLLRLLVRGLRNPAYWQRWGERFGYLGDHIASIQLWIHAVSVGEVRAATPLVNAILRDFPGTRILVTTMTPTGADQLHRSLGSSVEHCYAPYDFPDTVKRFLTRVKPSLAIVLETEIWPNIIEQCHRRHIPIVLTNVRLSARSHRGYRRFRPLIATALGHVARYGVQSGDDARRIIDLGAKPDAVTVTGSIKFEVQLPASLREVAEAERNNWGVQRAVWIVGSSHAGEEEIALSVYDRLKSKHPNLLLVLVPRHPERFDAVERLCRRAGYLVVRRSLHTGPVSGKTDVYLADTMGELALFYAASDVAFVGGSLVPVGGHNVLEVCAAGVPVLFGPHMFNFLEISRLVLECGAGQQVRTGDQLAAALQMYLADGNLRFKDGESGRRVVEENRGALQRTMTILRTYLTALDESSVR